MPEWLRSVVARGLAADPKMRFGDVPALIGALEHDGQRRRTTTALGAAALTLLAVGGLALVNRWHREHARCDGDARGGQSWSDARVATLRQGFAAVDKPYAADAAALVVAGLDRYRQTWVAHYHAACQSAQSAPVRDLELSCLDRRLDEWRTLGDVLSHPDADVTLRAGQAVGRLLPVEGCANAAVLTARVAPPPSAQSQLAAIDHELARARALTDAGKYSDALPVAEAAAAHAKAVGYRPEEAATLYQLGYLRERLGHGAASEATLRDSIRAAEAGRADDVLAQARIYLVWVVGLVERRTSEIDRLWADAQAAIERLGEHADPDLRPQLLTIVGATDTSKLSTHTDAAKLLQEALALRERGSDELAVASTLNDLGGTLGDLGRLDEARQTFERAAAIDRRLLGASHPETLGVQINLAHLLSLTGKNTEATTLLQSLQPLFIACKGPDHPDVAALVVDLAQGLYLDGHYDEALADFRRALAIWEKATSPDAGKALNGIAAVESQQHDYTAALRDLERARVLQTATFGAQHPSVAYTVYNTGDVYLASGQPQKAAAQYRTALRAWEGAMGPQHPAVALALTALGRATLAQKQPAAALPLLERALTIGARGNSDPVDVAVTQLALARALPSSARARARTLAEKARATMAVAPGRTADVHEIDGWLAAHPL